MADETPTDKEKEMAKVAFLFEKETQRNVGGRPRKYATPEEFDARVDKYYQHCLATDEPITWTGLALYLGFYGRKEIDEYLEYEGFSHSVKKAKSMVEYAYEKRMALGGQAAGPIFALKNFGWKDNQSVTHGGKVGVVAAGINVNEADPQEASKIYQQLMQGE